MIKKLRKFDRDFNYKFIKPISSLYHKENELNFIIPLWTISRLTLIRCTIFLESFFNGVNLKLNTVRFKNKSKKPYLLFTFPILNNLPVLELMYDSLSTPYCIGSNHGFDLVISFNSFFLFVPSQFDVEKLGYESLQQLETRIIKKKK